MEIIKEKEFGEFIPLIQRNALFLLSSNVIYVDYE